MIIKVKCGWCKKEFETDNQKNKDDYPVRICSHCGKIVSGSRKESTGNVTGRKHIHSDSKNGDVV
jgi:hypothetical protein